MPAESGALIQKKTLFGDFFDCLYSEHPFFHLATDIWMIILIRELMFIFTSDHVSRKKILTITHPSAP
jgi:hypothetical protein